MPDQKVGPSEEAAASAQASEAKPSTLAKLRRLLEKRPQADMVKTRRRFVGFFTVGFLVTNFLMFLRFFFPRTIFEPKKVFRIGSPDAFGIGVDTGFQKSNRIWVVRNSERLFVIYARCTHLGCTPDWKESEGKFKCPCHGSGFDPEGINYEGPAPRPLDRAKVELTPEGQIKVDTSSLYKESQFEEEDSYLVV